MGNLTFEKTEIGDIVRVIIVAAAVMALPGLEWTLLGWLHTFLPLLSFYILSRYGEYSGGKLLITASLISGIAYIIGSSADLYIFALVLLLSGYVLFKSALREDSPALSGLKCAATLAAGWILIISVFSIGQEVNAYRQLLLSLDEGVNEALLYYRGNSSVSPDTLAVLESTLYQMKVLVPIIMPAILGSLILIMTWITLVFGNILVLRKRGHAWWPNYRFWLLPDKLVWLLILASALALLPLGTLRVTGINMVILLIIVYCFQGLAVGVFFMTKWNVPLLFRSFFYVMVIFQSFGTVLLLIGGVADTWFDFRKIRGEQADNKE